MKSLKVLSLLITNSFQQVLFNRFIMTFFVISKILRITLFLFFLNFLLTGSGGLVGYTKNQVIFFYLTFNLIDTAAQVLFREVYRFRPLIVEGTLDFVLLKPINPLIRVLLGGMDLIDVVILFLVMALTVWVGVHNISQNLLSWLLYVVMVINGLIIAAAFHIFVLGMGVVTTTVDHLIMVYRDLTSMMRVPVDVYIEPLKSLLTFVIPLAIMFSFPPKVLMGLLSPGAVIIAFLISTLSLILSIKFWQFSLKHYQGAGS